MSFATDTVEQTRQRMMSKVAGLLAKAESTDSEEEADACLRKADELMVKYAILQSELKPEDREQITMVIVTIGPSTPNHMLWNAVCMTHDVYFVRDTGTKGPERRGFLYGFPSDIAFVQSLVARLLLQRESALRRSDGPHDGYFHRETARAYNRSFRLGFSTRVYKRLVEARKGAVDDAQPGTALVLASRKTQVDAYVKVNAGRLKSGRKTTTYRSDGGFEAGKAAGERADVSGGRNHISGMFGALNS